MASQAPLPPMNPWEAQALTHTFSNQRVSKAETPLMPTSSFIPRHDALIFPGLYCPSGFDMMNILLQVRGRPHPMIDLGPIDCSVSLTLCDLEQPDMPIVYASDSFCELTGYSMSEVLGQNCRFLQAPRGSQAGCAPSDKVAIECMSQAIRANQEIQLQLWNYKKNGQRFNNILSIIPITIGPQRHRYAVGLQCEI